MKVTPEPPVVQRYVVEMTREELERLYALSFANEGGNKFPEGVTRLHNYVPDDVKESAEKRFGL